MELGALTSKKIKARMPHPMKASRGEQTKYLGHIGDQERKERYSFSGNGRQMIQEKKEKEENGLPSLTRKGKISDAVIINPANENTEIEVPFSGRERRNL